MKFINKQFDEWYDTEGVRFFSQNHGSADGHYDYMKKAYLDGFYAGLNSATDIINQINNDIPEVN
jgi:hypothetical protein